MSQPTRGSLLDSSLASSEKTEFFNIKDEKETLVLLHTIHRSALSQNIKNQLRDLLFSYRQSNSENSFKNLKKVFLQYGFSVDTIDDDAGHAQNTPCRTPQKTSLGRSRLIPQFVTPEQKGMKVQAKKTAPLVSAQKSDQGPQTSAAVVTHEDVDKKKVDTLLSQNQSQKNPTTVKNHQVETVVSKDDKSPIVRIKEIKKLVNQKVGNPVSLIELNEEIGREYMNALLNAMKLANGGQFNELQDAMCRLEQVFAQVESLDLSKQESRKVSEKTEYKEEDVAPTGPDAPLEEETARYSTTRDDQVDQKQIVDQKENPQAQVGVGTEISAMTTPATPPASVQKPEVFTTETPEGEGDSLPDTKIYSVAKEKQLQELMRNNRSKAVQDYKKQKAEKIASMDPLMVPSVTAGLNQLLSEWSLFKSSGFFGTGPSGADHALYKKLQGLTMAAVIAGRFEGATPQIKQSITDYMNGWRYEEGIVHEHAETFEHYLRRVIKHILDKNKTSLSD